MDPERDPEFSFCIFHSNTAGNKKVAHVNLKAAQHKKKSNTNILH